MEEEKKAPKRKSHFLLKSFALLFVVYFVIQFIVIVSQIREKKQELAELQAQMNEQQLANDELQNLLDSGLTNEYIERIARDKLGLAYQGERVFIDISGTK